VRPIEIVLLALSPLALLRYRSRALERGVAGLGVGALALHATVEGVRWQLAFCYLFVLVLGVRALFPTVAARVPKRLRILAGGAAAVLLALTGLVASALPVFRLPTPTGSAAVGVTYLELVDARRADPFQRPPAPNRRLMVRVCYPAKDGDSGPYARYFHGSTALLGEVAAFSQLPRFVFSHLALVRTHAREDVAVSGDAPRYPVVLFSHGAGTGMEVSTSQCEDLASHGYIVMSIDHPYVSAATAFPDRIVTAREASATFDTPEPAEPITRHMADDDTFVLDTLDALNRGRLASVLVQKLDLTAIGIIGHSVGGAVAYQLALTDRRVKAAINLDGRVYVHPDGARPHAPLLMLANAQFHVAALQKRESLMPPEGPSADGRAAYDAAYRRSRQDAVALVALLKRSDSLYTIAGSAHMQFTDLGLFIGLRSLRESLQLGGVTEPARCLALTQALTVAFLDRYLKQKTADTVSPLLAANPELTRVAL
jgi:predicted dienelactone hydrolase